MIEIGANDTEVEPASPTPRPSSEGGEKQRGKIRGRKRDSHAKRVGRIRIGAVARSRERRDVYVLIAVVVKAPPKGARGARCERSRWKRTAWMKYGAR